MNTLDFLNDASLAADDFNANTSFIIDGFLAQGLITLVYADGGNGKSWLGFALAKYCAQDTKQVIYLDFDNPLSVLKERNINELLVANHPSLQYVQRSKSTLTPQHLLERLSDEAVSGSYDDCVFVFDSLRNFTNINNDNIAMGCFTQIMNLREAGATVIILHHSNKDGKNYQGSNNIRNSVDNMYQLSKLPSDDDKLHIHLEVKKERCAITDQALIIDPKTLNIEVTNLAKALISDEKKAFIEGISAKLNQGECNKTELLGALGRNKDDKTARSWLDEFDGTYWTSKKKSGAFTYQLAVDNQIDEAFIEDLKAGKHLNNDFLAVSCNSGSDCS